MRYSVMDINVTTITILKKLYVFVLSELDVSYIGYDNISLQGFPSIDYQPCSSKN